MRVWTSHFPEGVPEANFPSINVALACFPWVLTIMSDHSMDPRSPGSPTLTTGCGWLISLKKFALDMKTE